MRSPLRWALTCLLAVVTLAVAPASPALAANETLTVNPSTGTHGVDTPVALKWQPNPDVQCPTQSFTVRFRFDDVQVAESQFNPQTCSADATYTVPKTATCKVHTFKGAVEDPQSQTHPDLDSTAAYASFTVTCPKPTKSALPVPTILPTHSATLSRTPSPTPSPSASPTPTATPSATPSATPTPTPTATLAPVPTSSAVVTAIEPPDFPTPGGSSGTPWVVGGIALGLAGVGASVVFLRPKAGAPIAAGASAVAVAASAGLLLLAPADQPKPVITGSYTAGPGEGCAKGDVPVNGGFYGPDTPTGLRQFHPVGSSSDTGFWYTSFSVTGQGSTVCLRLGRPVVWRVRERTLEPTTPDGGVSCQTPESLLGGGFAVPWGLSGLASYPEAPMRWSVTNAPYTDGPAPPAVVSALCAELPDGLRTYVTKAGAPSAGVATARCFSGDAVLNGGYAGSNVEGSYPVDAGWAAQLGDGGGSAYAICFHPSRAFGLRSTAAHAGDHSADCGAGETVLAGGWSSGTDVEGLQHFEPWGSGWQVERNGAGNATAYVLCARHY